MLPGALLRNAGLKYVCKPVALEVANAQTRFTAGYRDRRQVTMTVGNGEGNYFADEATLDRLEGEGQVVFRYVENPNGSTGAIAGIVSARGNVLGLMPHPDRAFEPELGSADGAILFQSVMASATERLMSLKAMFSKVWALAALATLALIAAPAAAQTPAMTPDIPAKFEAPTAQNDWIKRTVMIPMRDGVKLYTVIVMKKGVRDAPILLSRTPYNAKRRAERYASPHIEAELAQMDEPFVDDGYIRVYQDIRGKYGSEGDYIVTRPLIGPLNHTKIDHTTDTWDTIDWLVKNTPESNGRVGMIGSSYDGFTTVMGLINPHPALKAAVPQSAMIDGWMGDDWFHYGAFRQKNLDYFTGQMSARGAGSEIPREAFDDYTNFLQAGSVGDYARAAGLDQIPFYNKVTEHPAYDEFWSEQALDKTLAAQPLKVPTMWVGALWNQGGHVGDYPRLSGD